MQNPGSDAGVFVCGLQDRHREGSDAVEPRNCERSDAIRNIARVAIEAVYPSPHLSNPDLAENQSAPGRIADRLTINRMPPICGSSASKTRRSMAKSSEDGRSTPWVTHATSLMAASV
jgi:hypothetical protein